MKKSQCIVLIPIYQEELNQYEKMSIYNTIDKFDGIYDIYYLIGNNFDIKLIIIYFLILSLIVFHHIIHYYYHKIFMRHL